jgi:hypothetical protein
MRDAASQGLSASNYQGDRMLDRRKAGRLAAVVAALGMILAATVGLAVSHYNQKPLSLKGAVVKQDSDPMKESPITDVEISEASGLATSGAKSNFTGYFTIPLRSGVAANQSVTLQFRHPDYQPLDLTEQVDDRLSIVHLVPIHKETERPANRPVIPIANILIRYSTVTTTQENIGTEARTFEIPNTGNVPCNNSTPCSPDSKWKAAIAAESLDAGEGSVFRTARVSCIAGPCPFTRVDLDGFSQGGRHIKVAVRNWSDTTTFLLQAEVYRPQINNIVRTAYPVILGTSLNFTLPPLADGPSIQAEINGENIIFPLGPKPFLSWALCNVSVDKNQAKIYRCDLKSEYGFRESK